MGIQDWLEKYSEICRESEEKYRQARNEYYFCCWLEDYLGRKFNYFDNNLRDKEALHICSALRDLKEGQLLEKKRAFDEANKDLLKKEKTLQARINMAREKITRIKNHKNPQKALYSD